MTTNINIQKQGNKFYLHIDTNSLSEVDDGKTNSDGIKCFDIELSKKELKVLKEAIN